MLRIKWLSSFSIIYIFTTLVIIPSLSWAEDSVHFGSIFTEENNYRAEETKENINKLTDQSQQQRNLEELYPDLKDKNHRLREIQTTPQERKQINQQTATPLNGAPQEEASHMAVVTNTELQHHVVYFLELRPIQGNTPKDLYLQSNTLNRPVARIEPGEMVKVVDTPQEQILKLRMDRDNQGLWKQVARKSDQDPRDLYVYYDWKNFDTVSPVQSALELDIMVPRDMSSIPVFSKPGPWTWKDCQLGSSICVDRIDQHVEAFLLDTGFTAVNDMRTRQDTYQLFYKIGYRSYNKEGKVEYKIGWIPSFFARRKISILPKNLLSTNEYGFSGFETDEERVTRLSKYYVFRKNMFSENRLSSRWLKLSPGEKKEVFDNTFSFDAVVSYNNFNMEQDFLSDKFKQSGVSAGIGVYVPLYVDLEIEGTFTYTLPIAQKPSNLYPKSPLFRGDQWLLYTTPIGINKMPLKVGLGMYYLTMFESQSNFGFKSFLGFQSKIRLENERFWFDVRFGPLGQDFNFDLNNREIGSSLGIRLDSSEGYNSLTLFIDYGLTTYTSPVTGHTTDFDLLNIGFRKSF
jgi:hypothetical protein